MGGPRRLGRARVDKRNAGLRPLLRSVARCRAGAGGPSRTTAVGPLKGKAKKAFEAVAYAERPASEVRAEQDGRDQVESGKGEGEEKEGEEEGKEDERWNARKLPVSEQSLV